LTCFVRGAGTTKQCSRNIWNNNNIRVPSFVLSGEPHLIYHLQFVGSEAGLTVRSPFETTPNGQRPGHDRPVAGAQHPPKPRANGNGAMIARRSPAPISRFALARVCVLCSNRHCGQGEQWIFDRTGDIVSSTIRRLRARRGPSNVACVKAWSQRRFGFMVGRRRYARAAAKHRSR
jgi:hypothetical protein